MRRQLNRILMAPMVILGIAIGLYFGQHDPIAWAMFTFWSVYGLVRTYYE